MSEPLHAVLEALPQSSLTTHVLGALDWIVPGEWQNITVFDTLIKDVTGETDEALIQKVGERALQLYADPSNGYARAVMVYLYRLGEHRGGRRRDGELGGPALRGPELPHRRDPQAGDHAGHRRRREDGR